MEGYKLQLIEHAYANQTKLFNMKFVVVIIIIIIRGNNTF